MGQSMSESTADSLAARVVSGDLRAVARAISLVENDASGTGGAGDLLRNIRVAVGAGRRPALTIGITGAPGAGKSSLVDRLALAWRAGGHRVGILAVDPSSPFSGGALLGDRIRMGGLAGDEKVFIRSMATRGRMGGLARGTIEAAMILEAAGFDRVLIETVGVGQDEVDIVGAADISVVVVVPGMGDDIQAIKAGIMEIGDLFVINKSEREGAARTERELIAMLEMAERSDGWEPPIIRTVATTGEGIDALVSAIDRCQGHLERAAAGQPGSSSRRVETAARRLTELLRERLFQRYLDEGPGPERLRELATAIARREQDPQAVVEALLTPSAPPGPEEPRHAEAEPGVRLGHLGVAVTSIEESLNFWQTGLGLAVEGIEVVAAQGVRVALLPVGESRIELLEPTDAETPVGKFLARRGGGIHHLCLEVADLPATLAQLKATGIRLIDEEPRRGAGGALIAFVHPAATGGVLLELSQRERS
jgi:LAO/AO transport system kinase